MTDNDLLQEIHRVREKLARECDYDPHKIGERMRQREREEKARGECVMCPSRSHGLPKRKRLWCVKIQVRREFKPSCPN